VQAEEGVKRRQQRRGLTLRRTRVLGPQVSMLLEVL
jgi:hypothetical protein